MILNQPPWLKTYALAGAPRALLLLCASPLATLNWLGYALGKTRMDE
jgi:hypothetical protein